MSDRQNNEITIVCLDGVGKLQPDELRQVIKEASVWMRNTDNRLSKYRSADGRYTGSFAGHGQFNLMSVSQPHPLQKGRI